MPSEDRPTPLPSLQPDFFSTLLPIPWLAQSWMYVKILDVPLLIPALNLLLCISQNLQTHFSALHQL